MSEEPVDHPDFDKAPFVRKHLDTQERIINIRLNAEEDALISEMKRVWHCDNTSTVIKKCISIARNVCFNLIGEENTKWLSEERRIRPRGTKV